MRFASEQVGGLQVFAVAGTNTISFGLSADAGVRDGLLDFAVKRADQATGRDGYLRGYKVFRSLVPDPTPLTEVSTYVHPIQSLVWDDFDREPDHTYRYTFQALKGDPRKPDRRTAPVSITVTTEPLTGTTHDIFFNRGVTSGQYYAKQFHNLAPEQQPTTRKKNQALAWLSRDLDEALLGFIREAQPGDAIRGCFYEFTYAPVLAELAKAITRGVDVQLIIDEKVNEHFETVKNPDGTITKTFVDSFPRKENLDAIAAASLPESAIRPRQARKDAIAHNKFMVLLRGAARNPAAVWTGSTNLTTGGIFGQANVGHLVRDATVAATYLQYWEILVADPGATTSAKTQPENAAFCAALAALTPTPTVADIPAGITPLFSPRPDLSALNLYVDLLGHASRLACATFAFGISAPFKAQLSQNTPAGPLCFLLLESKDVPNKKAKTPFVKLNAKNNVYEASGSELDTPLGQWVVETDNRIIGLNSHVAFIHLKVLLHDPLGADPVVVTGSANFSAASTDTNDENMILIRGDRRVADIYFTEFNRLWAHFQFRSVVEQIEARAKKKGQPVPSPTWQFLKEDASWLDDYEPGDLRSKRVDQYVTMAID